MIKADYAALKIEQFLRLRERGEIVWVTKNNNIIPIKDMSDTHLANTINMLEKNEFDYQVIVDNLGGDWQG